MANKQPHVHAELIKQWADGAKIQCYYAPLDQWNDIPHPNWYEDVSYRVKPEQRVWTGKVYMTETSKQLKGQMDESEFNLKLTFDPSGEKLISAEVV